MADSYERRHWNELYSHARDGHHMSDDPDASLMELAERLKPGTAIDLGAGEGRNALWLAEKGWKVTAVDVSDVALLRLENAALARNLVVRTVAMRFKEYTALGERADLIVVANIHPEIPQREKFFHLVAEMVNESGHVYVIGHHLDVLGHAGPQDPDRLFTQDSLRDAFPGFDVERLSVISGPTDLQDVTHAASVVLVARRPAGKRERAV